MSNYSWMTYRFYHEWEVPYTCETEVEIVIEKEDKVIGIGKMVEFNTSHRGPAPIYTLGVLGIPISLASIRHGGYLSNIKWREASGPSRAYYNGCGWHISPVILRWKDGDTQFNIRTSLSFMNGLDHEEYKKAKFDCFLSTFLGSKTS